MHTQRDDEETRRAYWIEQMESAYSFMSKDDAYAEYLASSGRPARYGPVDFEPPNGIITPIGNPEEPLHSLEDIEGNIELALSRLVAKGMG